LLTQDFIEKYPEFKDLVNLIRYEIQQAKRPPDQIIYDDVDLRNFLKVSKRTTAYWREKGIITFSKLGGKVFYKLSDILQLLKQNEIQSIPQNLKASS